ncbi:DUF3396 domain-containing protein [Pseudothauera nasutitermitis]|uniref:DUF3396 domain-containing protein n=1 Tax=Pseudothauera nasutitermitis TaxID=2565930 RepID=A0A4S4ANB7_9RHOO|nr:DUF3396 domain-containing protein [Pseudothauera nasutitermitis]THF61136.1 DUF3396 domain-containing protein [Pseudothauera nasutitermitis]
MHDATAIHPDDLDEFIRETLADDGLYVMGDEHGAAGVCPYISFYLRHPPERQREVASQLLAVAREFAGLADEPFRLLRVGEDGAWHACRGGRLPANLGTTLRRACASSLPFIVEATDRRQPADSARWALALRADTEPDHYSYLKLTFRKRWYAAHVQHWHAFALRAVSLLRPEHCYSGLEIGNGGFALPATPWRRLLEQACATRLPGLEHDDPALHTLHSTRAGRRWQPTGLGRGPRTPGWSFLLAPRWLRALEDGGSALRAALAQPGTEVQAIDYPTDGIEPGGEALWIRRGTLDSAAHSYPPLPGLPG